MKAMIKVRMNRTAVGAPDSITVKTYHEGQEYSIPEDLADCFFSTGEADPAEAHEAPVDSGKEKPAGGVNSEGGETAPETKKPATRKRGAKAASSDGTGA